MSRNLNRFRFQVRLDPFLPLVLAGFSPAFLLAFVTLKEGWLVCALVWVGLCDGLSKAARGGRLPGVSRTLTPHFYAVRTWGGVWSIFQRRPPGGCKLECKELLKGLVQEQVRLPRSLPPGRYQALTHDTVLRRLRAMPEAQVLEVTPAYTASLEHINRQMTGGRCRRCKKACPFLMARKVTRQFYYVCFIIREKIA